MKQASGQSKEAAGDKLRVTGSDARQRVEERGRGGQEKKHPVEGICSRRKRSRERAM